MLNVARKRPWTCSNYGRYFRDTTLGDMNRGGDLSTASASLLPDRLICDIERSHYFQGAIMADQKDIAEDIQARHELTEIDR